MHPSHSRRFAMAGAAAGAAIALLWLIAAAPESPPQKPSAVDLTTFARPRGLPAPPDNPQSPAKVALGQRLFNEPRLSGAGNISCATCHDPKLGFADGAPRSTAGATGQPLRRHTPALWNLAWSPLLYWDGRAESLEDQARFPMSHADEMAGSPEYAAAALARDPAYVTAFRDAFPGTIGIDGDLVLKALAAYERTLVSPPTRFDAWIDGDAKALEPQPQLGFKLFTGKAQCVTCHSGFAFTDHAFHDIGLPGADKGRGAVMGLTRIDHAFKTPTLRELAWTAPYMHDGSLPTLDDVVRHYEQGGVRRPSRSPDMPVPFSLTEDERAALIAFLESLSSDRPPQPSREAWIGQPPPLIPVSGAQTRIVSQRAKMFAPGSIKGRAGDAITILNDDTRTHNIRIVDRLWRFNSGAQEPGESVILQLDQKGLFEAHCAIHPTMRLRIEVE